MMARKLFMFLVVAAFSLGLASPGLSGVVGEEVRGTVTKIDGGKVNIKDFMGDEKTIEPKNPEALTGFKVGDRALVKDGILTKEGGSGPSAPSTGPRY
jgi:membrane-associated protease RseP (regulator of RpoE activity)